MTTRNSAGIATSADQILREDEAHVSGENGELILSVRRDSPITSAGSDGERATVNTDANGRVYAVTPGDDSVNNVSKVEHRLTPFRATADTLVKSGVGFVGTIHICGTQATPVAGLLTIYDNTAESGTVLHSEWVPATVTPHDVTLNWAFTTGLYISFDSNLAGIQVSGGYR